ncbi:MAG: branched-chain amino acid ABC transporter permease [Candidatus Rokuibacteriota bacterium]
MACRSRILAAALVGLLSLMPFVLNPYWVFVLGYGLTLAIACLGVNLLLGYTGLLSLGHAAYFGIGAYTGAFLFTFGDARSLEVYLASGILAAAALAAVTGAICVRTTRIHFSIMTLALAQVIHSLFVSGAVFRPFGGMGKGFFFIGHGGLYIPRFTMVGVELSSEAFATVFYYIILLAFLATAGLMWRVVNSPFGMALRAIRDNDTRAEFVGIPVRRYRWLAFVISGTVTGLAGGLFGQLFRQITPQQLNWVFSAQLVVAILLGGPTHFVGPVVGALAVVALTEIALRFALYHNLILGVLLVVVVTMRRRGLGTPTDRFFPALGRSAPWA